MAVVRTRGAASTWAAIRVQVREKIGDNNASRYTNTQINQALNDSMKEMYGVLGRDIGGVMTTANLTYASGAESQALDDSYAAAPIYRVEDFSDTNNPVLLDYCSPAEIESYRGSDIGNSDNLGQLARPRWSLLGESIVVRPMPGSAMVLRISYHPPVWVVTADADQHPFFYNFEELIVVGAAFRLLEVDGEPAAATFAARAARMLDDLAAKPRIRGQRRVARRGFRF